MRKNVAVIATVVLAASLATTTGYTWYKYKELKAVDTENVQTLQQQLLSRTRSGYLALTNIKAGDIVTDSMVVFASNIVSDVTQDRFINADDIGKTAATNIEAGMPVYKSNVTDESPDALRERECSFIWLNSNLKDYDFVDVRILFPNGEDYIVAAKKSIYDTRIQVNDVFLRLTEEEIQLLDAAIVDANMHNAKIYVTKYVNPEIQEASEASYSPSSDVMRVIANDPNIVDVSASALAVDARAAMDKRMQLFEEAYPSFTLDENAGTNSNYDEQFFNAESEVVQ